MTEHNTEKTVCPFCSSEWVTAAQHDRNVDRLEREPVAWLKVGGMKAMPALEKEAWLSTGRQFDRQCVEDYTIPLYTTPPQRKPLTDEEITDAVRDAGLDWHYAWTLSDEESSRLTKFARAIEAAHGIKENS